MLNLIVLASLCTYQPPPLRPAPHRVWLPRLHAIVAQLRPVRRVRLAGGAIGRHAVTVGRPGYDLGGK